MDRDEEIEIRRRDGAVSSLSAKGRAPARRSTCPGSARTRRRPISSMPCASPAPRKKGRGP